MVKEMVYGYERKVERLAYGSLYGIEFKIMNLGTHPCSYIRLTMDQAKALGYDPDSEFGAYCDLLNCHGGCTYMGTDPEYKEPTPGYIWAGWDYAHWGDFMGYSLRPDYPKFSSDDADHRYTTKELLADVIETITDAYNQLVEAEVEV